MAYELHSKENYTVEISGHVGPDEVETQRERLLKTYRKRLEVPGFRRGKAPLSLVKARLGDEVESELSEGLARKVWAEVVNGEEDLEPISDVRVSRADIDDDGTFRFSGEVDVRPRFELPDLEGPELSDIPIEVAEEEVEEELGNIAEQHAMWEPAEDQPIEDGMAVELSVSAEFPEGDGEPFDIESTVMVVGEERFGAELDEALQGAVPGDQRSVEVEHPGDHADERRAGKRVAYTATVRSTRKKVIPELDDDLAAATGSDDLHDLRAKVREVISGRKKAERRQRWRRELLDRLEAGLDPENLPPTVVEAALRNELDGVAMSLMARGVDPRSDDIDWKDLAEKAEPGARRNALDRIILEQLAEEWDLPVPEEQVEEYIRHEAMQSGVPVGEHRDKLESEGRLDAIRSSARIASVVDELIRRSGGEVD